MITSSWILSHPPTDRRVLIKYWPRHYKRSSRTCERSPEPKIEECFYTKCLRTSHDGDTLVQEMCGYYTPWCGDSQIVSTQLIMLEDIIEWMEIPS